jgi:conserved domain protein
MYILTLLVKGVKMQATGGYSTKIFKSGNSMAIRIPKAIDLTNYDEAVIYQRKNEIIIKPKSLKTTKWDILFKELGKIESDKIEVKKLPVQDREKYFD